MDSFEFNKIIGALLATVFVVFSVGIISDAIFASPVPENPGYAIEAAETEEGMETGAEPATLQPIGPLLASADVGAGEAVFKRCAACHTVEEGGANKVGPNLWDVVNRPVASVEGFSYSNAMQEFSEGGAVVWDYEHVSNFLLDPRGYIRGTAMSFAGLKDAEDRANIIAYLRTLSANPAPLPDPAAGPAAEAVSAPAGEEGAAPAAEDGAVPAEAAEDDAAPTPLPLAEEEAAPAAGADGEPAAAAEGDEAVPTPLAPAGQANAPADADGLAPGADEGTPAAE
jgi:cytochrome c